MKSKILSILCVSIPLLTIGSPVLAEDVWVTDQFEVMMRSGKGSTQRIVRQLKSGTRLERMDADNEAGYTQVRTGTGQEGWVLSRYLRSSPTAQLQLPAAQQKLERSESQRRELQQQLDQVRKEKQALQRELNDVQSTSRSQQNQLSRITKLSSNTILVDEENQQLKQQLADSEQQIVVLTNENTRLSSRSDREWFLVGGAVLAIGLLLGLILPRISWRKKSSWSDF